ncbi:VWA domain-containing protein [Streptomyces sp. NPDC003719]
MGILTLLRNAFGRSRKARAAQVEGATQEATAPAAAPEPKLPSQPTAPEKQAEETAQVPEPRTGTDEHELVRAAFTNITVPKPTDSPEDNLPPSQEAEPKAAPEPEAKAEAEPEAKAEVAAEPEPEVKAEPEPEPEVKAEPEPVTETEAETQPESEAKAEAEAESEAKPAPEADAKAEPEAEPEPEAEAKTEATAEPEAKAEDEPETRADVQPEPEAPAKADTEPEVDPAPAFEAEAAPEADARPEPTPEDEAEPAPKAAAPEPAAADGEEAPQGPPAPDDETVTGGAGGNPEADGEAEASEPATGDTDTDTGTDEAPQDPQDPQDPAPGLSTAYKAAGTALKRHDLTGTRAKVYLVLDRSASMRPYYKDGSAQALAEQTLALAAHLDPEPTLHVTFFSTEVDGTGELTLADHENKIDELHGALGRMGRTSYHAAVEAVLARHDKETAGTPALVVFQTDGAPDAKTPATRALTDAAASHPHVHFSFVAFGDPENKAFDYLRKLKTGNASHFLAGETPLELTDKELYEGVLADWRP